MIEPDRPLRIAHLAFSSLPATVGGLEVVVDTLIRAQQDAGHDVRLVTRWRHWRAGRAAGLPYPVLGLPPNPISGGGRVGPGWPVAATVALHQARHRFDLWHVHSLYPAGWMAHRALTAMGVPVILTPHGMDVQIEPATNYGLRLIPRHERRILKLVRRAARMTAISDATERHLRDMAADPAAIVPIPNGVPASRIAAHSQDGASVRKALSIPADSPVALSVGRNEPHKGLHLVPPALARVRRRRGDLHWIVVGKDSAALLAPAQDAGVADLIRCVPPITGNAATGDAFPPARLIDLYKSADVLIVPSLMESFGLVALEGMAAGLPVVASRISGLAGVVGDTGLLFSPGSVEELASVVEQVLDDADLRAGMIARGAAKAAAHEWAAISSRYLALYAEACTHPTSRRAG